MTKGLHIPRSSRRFNHSRAGTAGIFIVLLIMAVFMALPMVLIIGNAFKPSHELWAFPPKLFPTDWTLGNFGDMFTVLSDSLVPLLRYLYNTLYNFRLNVRVRAFKAAVSGKENHAAAGCSFAYVQ